MSTGGILTPSGISLATGNRLVDHLAVTSEEPPELLAARWSKSTIHLDMWVDPDDDPRESGDALTGERSTLLDYLRRYRLTLEMKCADLDTEELARRSVPPSTMSLLGLLRHMSDVERQWFRRVMAGENAPPLYWTDEDQTTTGTAPSPTTASLTMPGAP